MKLTFNDQSFPADGVETRCGKLVIVNGNDIDSVEIHQGTHEGQRLRQQAHLAFQVYDAYADRHTLKILASAPTKADLEAKMVKGITVHSTALWMDALPRKSALRQNCKVEGLFL